jgi:hypothetical protein
MFRHMGAILSDYFRSKEYKPPNTLIALIAMILTYSMEQSVS